MPKDGRRPFVQFYEEAKATSYQEHVQFWARQQIQSVEVKGGEDFRLPVEGRVLATVRFNIVKPPSYPPRVVHMTRKPDLDNLVKSVLDALTKARVLKDDALVTDLMLLKRYATPDHPEGVEVDLTILPDTR